MPVDLYSQFAYSELTTNVRQQGDGRYAALLDRARLGQLNEEDVALLRSRLLPVPDGQQRASVAVVIDKFFELGAVPLDSFLCINHFLCVVPAEKGVQCVILCPYNELVEAVNNAVIARRGLTSSMFSVEAGYTLNSTVDCLVKHLPYFTK